MLQNEIKENRNIYTYLRAYVLCIIFLFFFRGQSKGNQNTEKEMNSFCGLWVIRNVWLSISLSLPRSHSLALLMCPSPYVHRSMCSVLLGIHYNIIFKSTVYSIQCTVKYYWVNRPCEYWARSKKKIRRRRETRNERTFPSPSFLPQLLAAVSQIVGLTHIKLTTTNDIMCP